MTKGLIKKVLSHARNSNFRASIVAAYMAAALTVCTMERQQVIHSTHMLGGGSYRTHMLGGGSYSANRACSNTRMRSLEIRWTQMTYSTWRTALGL